MTETQKQSEIALRITRLNDIRSDLTVAKSKWRKQCGALKEAGLHADHIGPESSFNNSWPTPEAFYKTVSEIKSIRKEADTLISELRDLGIDADLFKINGS